MNFGILSIRDHFSDNNFCSSHFISLACYSDEEIIGHASLLLLDCTSDLHLKHVHYHNMFSRSRRSLVSAGTTFRDSPEWPATTVRHSRRKMEGDVY